MTTEAQQHRNEAAALPDGDIVAVLLRQHADITDSMERIKTGSADSRADGWNALTAFLEAHETAEQQVVHPISRRTASVEQAEARLAEEREADEAIAELNELQTDTAAFGTKFAEFAEKVHEHAEHEEHEEFPSFDALSTEVRQQLGSDFLAAFEGA